MSTDGSNSMWCFSNSFNDLLGVAELASSEVGLVELAFVVSLIGEELP